MNFWSFHLLKVDQQIAEWKLKCDETQAELDKSQKESRAYSAELLKLRSAHEEANERYEILKRENKSLTIEITTITEQLTEGGRSSHEIEKLRRKLELEKEELTAALEEAEGALEQEEAKALKFQLEVL